MTRVLFLSPACTDSDVRRHAETIAALPGVTLVRRTGPAEDRLAFVLRSGAGVFRSRHSIDVVITVGTAALNAASFGWGGPIVHLVAGRLTRGEAAVCRTAARRREFRLVTSSASVARVAMTHVADVHKIRLLRPSPAVPALDRNEVRRRLKVAADAPLVQIVGTARTGSGHRLAMWATSILVFRDPATRVALSTGGPRDAFVRRFSASTAQSKAIVADPNLSEADLAAAADVALCLADGPPEWSALAALQREGVPIVALRSTWDRERLHDLPAILIDHPMARVIARAALAALESDRPHPSPGPATASSDPTGHEWSQLLRTIAPTLAVIDH